MSLVYSLSIFLYRLVIHTAALFGHVKAKRWVTGRKKIFDHIEKSLLPNEKRVWFHCASLGEFEQGRPLIEKIRIQKPDFKIVLTFFSPSGYEIRKNYPGADYIFYLPADTRYNAAKFISLISPEKVFFVKYEYWFFYFSELGKRNIPLYVVSAVFRSQQKFFRWYGNFFRKMLGNVTFFFVQDNESGRLLGSIGFSNFEVTGDTRFDRVNEVAVHVKPVSLVEKFKNGNKVLVCGSTWEKDEQLILSMLMDYKAGNLNLKLIIAPHEINESRISILMNSLKNFKVMRYSERNEVTISSAEILVIDNIGMLSSLYQYGSFAFIGGGFGNGIHNILEAAAFGMPVFFGPNYKRFREANELIAEGGAFSVHSSEELKIVLMNFLDDEGKRRETSAVSKQYVQSGKGATEKILRFVNNPPTFRNRTSLNK